MQYYEDLRSKKRELAKFYDKVRPHFKDLLLEPDECSDSQTDDDSPYRFDISKIPEENLYGKVTKDEFEKILDSYDRLQNAGDVQSKQQVTCKSVVGGSFAKLLYSKPGFHHQGSTSFLTHDLGTRTIHRNSFLGGLSTYALRPGESLEELKQQQTRLMIESLVAKAHELLDAKQLDRAKLQIDEAIKLGPKNGDALAVRGRYRAATSNVGEAIEDFKLSLKNKPEDENLVKSYLSDSLYQYGLTLYNRSDYKNALALFSNAILFKEDHDGARYHKTLCEDQIKSRMAFTQNPLAYRR